MADKLDTSITMLHALAESTANDQWYMFYNKYKDAVFGFVYANYPTLEPDDILQETMKALSNCLPTYQYTPDEKGHFRNFLMGIVRHKAVDAIRKRARENEIIKEYRDDPTTNNYSPSKAEEELKKWRQDTMETAIEQLMADTSISANTRTIFEHVALLHEPPEEVAAQFGTTRNNVDQIKNRMIGKLNEMVERMAKQNPPKA